MQARTAGRRTRTLWRPRGTSATQSPAGRAAGSWCTSSQENVPTGARRAGGAWLYRGRPQREAEHNPINNEQTEIEHHDAQTALPTATLPAATAAPTSRKRAVTANRSSGMSAAFSKIKTKPPTRRRQAHGDYRRPT